ncbi:MAG: hypothetical protein ACRC46_03785 [Thermoguttaceae bacterium]
MPDLSVISCILYSHLAQEQGGHPLGFIDFRVCTGESTLTIFPFCPLKTNVAMMTIILYLASVDSVTEFPRPLYRPSFSQLKWHDAY